MPLLNRRSSPKRLILTNLCISKDETIIGLIYEKNKINIYRLIPESTNYKLTQIVLEYSIYSIAFTKDMIYLMDDLQNFRTIPIPE